MNNANHASKLLCVIVSLLLLPGCGFFSPSISLGGNGSSQKTGWGQGNGKALAAASRAGKAGALAQDPLDLARAQILALADGLVEEAPDVIALLDAATWRQEGIVLHDDVAQLLDELWRAGLDYEPASELVTHQADGLTVRHVLLAREDGVGEVVGASGSRYREPGDGWVAVEVDADGAVERILATGLGGSHAEAQAQELLDALSSVDGSCVVVCDIEADSPVSDAFHADGFVIVAAGPQGLLLERAGG